MVYALMCFLSARRVWQTDLAVKGEKLEKMRMRSYLVWTSLSACGVLVLMAVTGQTTVPFL